MITKAQTFRVVSLTLALLLLAGAAYSQTRRRSGSARKSVTQKVPSAPASQQTESTSDSPNLVHLKLSDGTRVPVDEAWESQQGIWYKRGGVSYLIPRERVKAIERGSTVEPGSKTQVAKSAVPTAKEISPTNQPVWIYLVDGARLETDSADESTAGVWCRRGPLSLFIERSRIDHIEREELKSAADSDSASKERGWSTGSAKIDLLIKQNGAKYGVDPYLVFCVMEQESHFSTRSVSPKGARGLMQLMPGTSARFGVRHPFSPAENISAGTRYLKKLIEQFNGRVDLVLASYNAGEGTVIRYGSKVPPYKETRDYVKRISYRYRRSKAPIVRTPNSVTSSGRT